MAADVPQFQYRPLATNEIRLLYLVPNHMNPNQLHLRLVHTAFEPTPVYQALSYVWGRPLEEHLLEVLCSSEPTSKESGLAGAPSLSSMVQSPRSESYFGDDTTGRMRITPNLHAALAAIRPSKEFPMWVDAISINQKDNMQEKQEQVLRMHEIFQLAEEVIIWFHPSFERQEGPLRRAHGRKVYFGPIPDGTEVSIELYRWLEAYMEDEDVMFEGFPRLLRRFETSHDDIDGYPSFTPEQVRNLGRFLKQNNRLHTTRNLAIAGLPSDYDRIWTFLDQLSSHAWLTRTWTFQEVMLAKKATIRSGDCFVSWTCFLYISGCLRTSLGDPLPGVRTQAEFEGRTCPKWNFLSPFSLPLTRRKYDAYWLMSLLTILRMRNVTEPVDRVYGILALLSLKSRAGIPIDYSEAARKQYWHLYTHVTQIMMASGYAYLVLQAVGPGDRLLNLPSWCPNYNVESSATYTTAILGRAGYFCGRDTLEILEPSLDPALIHLGGSNVDTVKLVLDNPTFESSAGERSRKSIARTNLRWLRTIEQIIRDNVVDPNVVPTIFWQCMLGYIPPAPDGSGLRNPACSEEGFASLMLYLDRMHTNSPPATIGNIEAKRQENFLDTVLKLAHELYTNRRFFATEKGHFGWANVGTEAGDNVCVFLGHEVLYLLTPPETKTVNGRLGAYREFRSPAYVHGMMMGEALKDFKEGEHEMFNII